MLNRRSLLQALATVPVVAVVGQEAVASEVAECSTKGFIAVFQATSWCGKHPGTVTYAERPAKERVTDEQVFSSLKDTVSISLSREYRESLSLCRVFCTLMVDEKAMQFDFAFGAKISLSDVAAEVAATMQPYMHDTSVFPRSDEGSRLVLERNFIPSTHEDLGFKGWYKQCPNFGTLVHIRSVNPVGGSVEAAFEEKVRDTRNWIEKNPTPALPTFYYRVTT